MKRITTFAFVAALATTACARGPIDGASVNSSDRIDFHGFAVTPNATIRLQARVPGTQTWQTFYTTFSAATPYNFGPFQMSRDLYSWGEYVTVPSWAFSGNAANVRVEQQVGSGGGFFGSYMYTAAGYQCLIDETYAAYFAGEVMNVDDVAVDCSAVGTPNGQALVDVTITR